MEMYAQMLRQLMAFNGILIVIGEIDNDILRMDGGEGRPRRILV